MEAVSLEKILNTKYYFHRDEYFEGYLGINATYPIKSDSFTKSYTLPKGYYNLSYAWITPKMPKDYTLNLAYTFKFSLWCNSSSSGVGFFSASFWRYRNDEETYLYHTLDSPCIPQNNVLEETVLFEWIDKTLNIQKDDRLIIRLNLRVLNAGKFSFGFDCIQYPSYLLDPSTLRLVPQSNNDVSLVPSTGTNYQCVDEYTPNDATDFVESTYETATYRHDLYNLNDTGLADGTAINSVTNYWRARKYQPGGSTTVNGRSYIKVNGSASSGSTIALTTSYVSRSTTYNTNPTTSASWTTHDVDSLLSGEEMKTTNPDIGFGDCTQNYVIVEYVSVITQKLYHSLNIDVGLSQFLKTVYHEYSDLTIIIGLSSFLKPIFSWFSNLNIDVSLSQSLSFFVQIILYHSLNVIVGLTQTLISFVSISLYHSLTIIVSLSQYFLVPSIVPYLIPFWIAFFVLIAVVLALLLRK